MYLNAVGRKKWRRSEESNLQYTGQAGIRTKNQGPQRVAWKTEPTMSLVYLQYNNIDI